MGESVPRLNSAKICRIVWTDQKLLTCLSSLISLLSACAALKGKLSLSERESLWKRGRNCLVEVDVPTDRARTRACQSWIILAAIKKNLTVKSLSLRSSSVWGNDCIIAGQINTQTQSLLCDLSTTSINVKCQWNCLSVSMLCCVVSGEM